MAHRSVGHPVGAPRLRKNKQRHLGGPLLRAMTIRERKETRSFQPRERHRDIDDLFDRLGEIGFDPALPDVDDAPDDAGDYERMLGFEPERLRGFL